ncbi:hypothetical protein M8818_002329 [Zalaria obscura]|uniref:Uncharacterized protein n=1 Tax=Zalaria obscura TaxID=2024903 RepID=A0ACC3SI27_9PEZI
MDLRSDKMGRLAQGLVFARLLIGKGIGLVGSAIVGTAMGFFAVVVPTTKWSRLASLEDVHVARVSALMLDVVSTLVVQMTLTCLSRTDEEASVFPNVSLVFVFSPSTMLQHVTRTLIVDILKPMQRGDHEPTKSPVWGYASARRIVTDQEATLHEQERTRQELANRPGSAWCWTFSSMIGGGSTGFRPVKVRHFRPEYDPLERSVLGSDADGPDTTIADKRSSLRIEQMGDSRFRGADWEKAIHWVWSSWLREWYVQAIGLLKQVAYEDTVDETRRTVGEVVSYDAPLRGWYGCQFWHWSCAVDLGLRRDARQSRTIQKTRERVTLRQARNAGSNSVKNGRISGRVIEQRVSVVSRGSHASTMKESPERRRSPDLRNRVRGLRQDAKVNCYANERGVSCERAQIPLMSSDLRPGLPADDTFSLPDFVSTESTAR